MKTIGVTIKLKVKDQQIELTVEEAGLLAETLDIFVGGRDSVVPRPTCNVNPVIPEPYRGFHKKA